MTDRRSVTWQWIAGISVAIIITVAGYAYTDTQKKIELKADKDDVAEMRQDLREIKAMMTSHIIESGSGRVVKRRESP